MTLHDFARDLEDVLALSRMKPESREYRKEIAGLLKEMGVNPDLLEFSGRRRWARVYLISTLAATAYIIVLFTGLFLYGKTLEAPISDAGFLAIMAGILLISVLLAPAGYASVQINRLRRQYVRIRIDLLAGRLQKLTAEEFHQIDALLHHVPDFFFEEDIDPITPCGCYDCVLSFHADVSETECCDPVCPQCGSNARIVYGGGELPIPTQSLQILHDLFDEE